MNKPKLMKFDQFARMTLQRYERYLPTAFDESLTLLEKMNKLIEYLNEMGVLVNDVVEQWNEVMEWIVNDGINDTVINRLNEMVDDGTMEHLINDVVFSEFNEKLQYLENHSQVMETLAVNVDMFENPEDAMEYAHENNYRLNWGNTHHVLNSDLPNFNNVKHLGHGSIEIDGHTFYLNPGYNDVNTLFVREYGDNSNMGVSPAQAFRTIQHAIDVLRRRDETLGGRWVIDVGVGTFGGATINNLESQRTLSIVGKIDEQTKQPTTIISSTIPGGTGGSFGLRVEPAMKDLLVENIMFSQYNNTSTSYGFLMKTGGKTVLKNCRAYDCTIGFACINSGVISTSSCIAKRCDTGYRLSYGGTATFGGSGLFGVGTGSQALECITGVSITRNGVAHVDYMEIEDCTYAGIDVNMSSRVHVLGSHFKRNKIGVDASGSSEWINNDSLPNYFYEGTANENEVNYGHFGVARESRLYSQRSGNDFRTFVATPESVTTGDTNRNIVVATPSLYYLPKYFLRYPGRKIKVVVSGDFRGNGDKTVEIILQNIADSGGTGSGIDTLDEFNYPGESSVRPFRYEFELDSMGNNKATLTGTRMIQFATYPYAKSRVIDLSNTALRKQLRVRTQLSDPSDAIHIHKVEMYVMG